MITTHFNYFFFLGFLFYNSKREKKQTLNGKNSFFFFYEEFSKWPTITRSPRQIARDDSDPIACTMTRAPYDGAHVTHSCSFLQEHYSLSRCESVRSMCVHYPSASHTESLHISCGRLDKCQSVSSRITIPIHLRCPHSRCSVASARATRNKNNAKRDYVLVVVAIVVARSRTKCGVGKLLLLAVICLFHCMWKLPAMLLPSSTTLDSVLCPIWMNKVRIANLICWIFAIEWRRDFYTSM